MRGMSPSAEATTVSCPCGATMEVDLRSPSRRVTCPECRQALELLITTDPGTKKKRVGILIASDAMTPRKGKSKSRSGGPADEVHKAKCTCGALIMVDPESMDSVHTCASCGAGFTAVLKRGRGPGLSTLVLMHVKASPVTKVKPKPTVPAKEAALRAAAGGPLASPARENILLMAKGDLGAQEVLDRGEDGTFIACFCGKEIPFRASAQKEMMKCPECALSFRLFLALHPRTKKPMAVTLPRGPVKPKP